MECQSCLSNQGIRRISPGEPILIGRYWRVEHAYPCGLLGWLVVVLNRHCEELHSLTADEWTELSGIQSAAARILHAQLGARKEYTCCFAEAEGFHHIHFHVIPKALEFNEEKSGVRSFEYLKVEEAMAIDKERIRRVCALLKEEFRKEMFES